MAANSACASDMRPLKTRTTRSTRTVPCLGTLPSERVPWGSALRKYSFQITVDLYTRHRRTEEMRFLLVRIDFPVLVWNPLLFKRDPHALVERTKLHLIT